jgi:Ca2+-transporting ATPase
VLRVFIFLRWLFKVTKCNNSQEIWQLYNWNNCCRNGMIDFLIYIGINGGVYVNLNWYNKSIHAVSQELQVDVPNGLPADEVDKRLKKFGENELKEKAKQSLISKIINQFKDFLVLILIGASIVSGIVGEISDAIVIVAIVIVNAVLGVLQEGKAEQALAALKKMSSPNAKALRNGSIQIIPAKNLVPGDIVLIEAGDSIPADLRLVESVNLKVEEASLTGESVPVDKNAETVFDTDVPIGDRKNMAYMSTVTTYGRGKGIVVGTGINTQIGKIAEALQSYKDETTPLQQKLNELGRWLGIGCLIICVLVFGIGFVRGGDLLELFLVAVSLAVAAIPEGLPAVVTIVLALGMKKMVQRNAIVRKLLAVETLGCVTVICSDKTGTLTQNEMTVVKAYSAGNTYTVTGQGYNPKGEFYLKNNIVAPDADQNIKLLLALGVLANDAILELKDPKDNQWGIIGDPTEGALVTVGAKGGMQKDEMNSSYHRVAELPFDSDRKMMTTFHKDFIENKIVSFTKGAPDIIISKCSRYFENGSIVEMTKEKLDQIASVNSQFAGDALRVLAFAYRGFDALPEKITTEEIEKDLIFVGLMGMIDPARVEALGAIKTCRKAGIKPVMITGDYKDTAVAIAKELGLMVEGDMVLTGADLDKISDQDLYNDIENISVYARVSPEHKVRIVETLRRKGHIAAMTGDGVNDAMALKRADIGVSMGITGTDVAKGTADIILMDDNFATIVAAVEEGRVIYSNIRKFVFFLLSCNVGEILIIFLSILFNLPVPLVPIQLLWVNLVTDSFPALALGTEKGEPDIMNLKPRDAKEPILDKVMIAGISVQSISLFAAVMTAYIWALNKYAGSIFDPSEEGLMIARTVAFATLILAELIRAYSSRSERYSIIKIGVFTNRSMVTATAVSLLLLFAVIYIPILEPIFKTYALQLSDWGAIIVLCMVPLLAGEINKFILSRRAAKAQ